MAYKKPEIVAKSAAKLSFVAGCPANYHPSGCNVVNSKCQHDAKKI